MTSKTDWKFRADLLREQAARLRREAKEREELAADYDHRAALCNMEAQQEA